MPFRTFRSSLRCGPRPCWGKWRRIAAHSSSPRSNLAMTHLFSTDESWKSLLSKRANWVQTLVWTQIFRASQWATIRLSLMKKLFWPMLAWLSFCAFATMADARVVESFKIRGWRADAFVSDQTGKFDSCVAIARYRNQISMSVQVDANYNWWIGFSALGWTMTPGEKIALSYRIDQGSWQQGTAEAITAELARMPMPAGGYIITCFRRDRVLTVSDQVNTYRFKLTGLTSCVQKNSARYGVGPLSSNTPGNSTNAPANVSSPYLQANPLNRLSSSKPAKRCSTSWAIWMCAGSTCKTRPTARQA